MERHVTGQAEDVRNVLVDGLLGALARPTTSSNIVKPRIFSRTEGATALTWCKREPDFLAARSSLCHTSLYEPLRFGIEDPVDASSSSRLRRAAAVYGWPRKL
jgi:hypothetical protein